jgi:hypothetical protein
MAWARGNELNGSTSRVVSGVATEKEILIGHGEKRLQHVHLGSPLLDRLPDDTCGLVVYARQCRLRPRPSLKV